MKNRTDNLKRVIVDYKKLTSEILTLLVEKYPDGYDDDHIISFRNQHNEIIEAVEVTTIDTKYLVKVSSKLADSMENFEEDSFDNLKDGETHTNQSPVDAEDLD